MTQPRLPPGFQWWKGSIRVRLGVPEACRGTIGKRELVKALDTTNVNVALDRGASWLAGYRQMIRDAKPANQEWEAFRPSWQFGFRRVGATADLPSDAPEMIDVTPAAPALPAAYTFTAMINDCAADRSGWPPERIKTITSTFGKLAAHIGHDDAKRVTSPS